MKAKALPPRALRTTAAAAYLGLSASYLRKQRARGADDPGDAGPAWIKLSPSLVVYEVRALDDWIESRRRAMPRLEAQLAAKRRA